VDIHSDRRAGLRLPMACCVLALAVALAAAAGGVFAHQRHGAAGLAAVAVAALTCGASAMAALIVAGALAGTRWGVHGILAASLLRFSLPLLVVAVSTVVQGPLARAGLPAYTVIFFLLALVVETVLLVNILRSLEPSKTVAWKG
jgi:hypothetical protein